eukprot:TRINITY_DN465_c1_g1_i2.p1 TRINITY_DN465_c1_g1~~TRINITY_DN465_c1_g1_i2.p1  ORF type:complete len:246 (-),score=74.84 TRINITY_DN465_c1_g1_i2:157-894(-)
MGGFGNLSNKDVEFSEIFINELYDKELSFLDERPNDRVVDCGAGIGRVTNLLLKNFFTNVDLVDPCQHFLDQAKETLGPENTNFGYICTGLQSFKPSANTYDAIWIQWVIGHLTDEDMVKFLKTCTSSLRENGVIILKENVATTEQYLFDDTDSSVTRSKAYFEKIFLKADMHIIKSVKQESWPKRLYPVYMYALCSKSSSIVEQISVSDDNNELENNNDNNNNITLNKIIDFNEEDIIDITVDK